MTDPTPTRPRRDRETGREERMEILRLLEAGDVTADEAGMLLDALDIGKSAGVPGGAEPDEPTRPIAGNGGTARGLIRIRVTEGEQARGNLAVPFALIEAGLGIAEQFVPEYLVDAKTIREAIKSGSRGPILEVNDGAQRVEIVVE